MSDEPNNMELWNAVSVTNPEITKRINTYTTAICAQHQIKRATEVWGAYGDTWGMRKLKWDWVRNASGDIELLSLDAEFWYPDGYFEIGGESGYARNNDNKKKLLTDTTTKALSKLGFNSDVFEGKFDDFNYVQYVAQLFASGELSTGKQLKPGRPKGPPVGDKGLVDLVQKLLQFIYSEKWREQAKLLAQEVTRETRPDDTQSLISTLNNEELQSCIDRLRVDADARKLKLPEDLT